MTANLELRNVTKIFPPDIMAVDEVSLTLAEGEFFSLLGPSGCGKSTLLRMIAGLEMPTSGEIWLDGQNITAAPPYQRHVNMVFQSYGLFPHMTVKENIAYGLKVKRVPSAEIAVSVKEVIQMVQLDGLEQRRPMQLSGGQQQRVALARALVNYPAVLLLDEPFGALDQKLREEMERELVNLQRQIHITFLFVTHNQREAMIISDRMAVMRAGQLEQIGRPQAIYETPATRFVADFIGKSNFLQGTYQQRSNGFHGIAVANDLLWIQTDADVTPGAPVTVMIRPEKIHLSRSPVTAVRNLLQGHIQEMVYEGTDTRYFVRLASNGPVIEVLLPNVLRTEQPAFAMAQPVYLSIEPHNISVIQDR